MSEINDILNERGSRYGSFENHAKICQTLKAVINTNLISLDKHLASDQMQALDVICDKIARMINGDPNYLDNWVDIAGYATLVMNRLKKDEEIKNKPINVDDYIIEQPKDEQYAEDVKIETSAILEKLEEYDD